MRLLIITQRVDQDDSVLGFMHGWIKEFSKQIENVNVVCLEKGNVDFSENVRIFSLGKEKFKARNFRLKLAERFIYSWRFIRHIVRIRKDYDVVFVHMNPEYVVLGGWLWKLWGKTVTLWYAHKNVTLSLRVAEVFTDMIFTSTKSGFRLASQKLRIIGQGIDTDKFKIHDLGFKSNAEKFKIITVGRITPSKDYEVLVEAVEIIRKRTSFEIKVDIVGPTSMASDRQYLDKLRERVVEKGLGESVSFKGSVPNRELPGVLAGYDLFVNMGHTGSLDKAVPEAMAVGLPVLTCNEAFKEVLGPYKEVLMYSKGDILGLADRLKYMMDMTDPQRLELGSKLRDIVVLNHSLTSFVKKIITEVLDFKKNGN
ncbi:MAG: glycosyltransferase [Candidatus Taylorbacteria bacterium]|nr:glycosyltransferase [Candidatus Taylorbacteria bacterium]